MIRKAFVMQLNPGQRKEYERRHRPVWPEMDQTLKSHGVHNYSIFWHDETNQLFAYVEIESEERWNAIASTPVCKKWWAYMKDVMASNPDNSPLSKGLEEVFHID